MASSDPIRVVSQDQMGTRLGRIGLTGFVDDGPWLLPRPRRVFDAWAIVLVHDGHGTFVDDAAGERPIGPGDAILVVPGRPHWYGPARGTRWSEVFVVFDGPVFDALAAAGVLSAEDPVRRLAPAGAWRERLAAFAARPRPAGTLERELEVLELAGLLVELRGSAAAEPAPRPIVRARELLAADLAARLDLRELAAGVGLPYETFRKRFRAATGASPNAYRLDRRVDAAKTLLRMTAMTHAAIAAQLGFADEYHFAKRFRGRVGVSPRAYRRASAAPR